MNKLFKIVTTGFFLALFVGCEDQPQMLSIGGGEETANTKVTLRLSQPKFSSDYKTIVLDAWLGQGIGSLPLADSSKVRITVTEKSEGIARTSKSMWPRLVKTENVAAKEMEEKKVAMLALIDLTLPQHVVDQERRAVEEIRNLFSNNNLYVAFIEGTTVSETMPATDYLLNNYFVHMESDVKYLYRAILDKMAEMDSIATWASEARYMAMTVMSDGTTYINDLPMDPDYFAQEQLLAESRASQPLYFANFGGSQNDDLLMMADDFSSLSFLSDSNADDTSVLQIRCQASGGLYQKKFDWPAIASRIEQAFGLEMADYRFTLENPDHKVYRGRHDRDLRISCYDTKTDSLIAEGDCVYSLGSVYRPIIVHPISLRSVLLQGLFYAILLILLVYAVLQFVVPYVKYRLFLRKYVLTYNGRQMSTDNQLISQSCYLCKSPFTEGDRIVTKCSHTMHLGCWNENQYQCPEYGRHCHDGRHYFNRHNLFDPQNATFYLNWLVVAIVAGWTAWMTYTIQMHPFFSTLSERSILFFSGLQPGTPEASAYIAEYGSHVNHFPSFGLSIGLFLTLMLSCLSVAKREWLPRLIEIGYRSLLGGLGGLAFFLLGGVISVLLGFTDNTFLIDWIPWALTAYWIALCVAWHTRIRLRYWLIGGAFFIGLISTYLWTVLYGDSSFDYRVTLLTIFVLFAVALAVAIANTAPHSERYFLSVGGIAKQMDIALYKWFKANSNDIVTIGLSVDCHLQLSWDIQSNIAPIQAEIRMQGGVPRLYAVEEGVFVSGKPLKLGKAVRLYHGKSFTIGKTEFTYIEKDK